MCTINHDKKAIFLNIPKTGRTYISSNLVKYYGFTQYLDKDPQHSTICETKKYNESHMFANKKFGILEYYKNSKYLCDLMNMNDEKWNTYYKFCFVRNPYTRVFSAYEYINKINPITNPTEKNGKMIITRKRRKLQDLLCDDIYDIKDYIYIHLFMTQSKNIKYNDLINIDFIGRFENLENDFIKILKIIGFDDKEIIHSTNKINETTQDNYDDYYSNTIIINKINELYGEDFENFNYSKILL